MSIDKLDFNNTVNDVGEWFINEDLDLAYFSVLASDSVPLVLVGTDSDPISAIHVLTSLHAPIRSSFMMRERENDAHGVFFKVSVKYKG